MMKKHKITLALQGGGSHGAFTWGVLDRLLEEEALEIVGISGTSAGAINGALVATGLVTGDSIKAKNNLENFWKEISKVYAASYVTRFGEFFHYMKLFDEFWVNRLLHLFSTFDFAYNSTYEPLKDILDKLVDYECLRNTKKVLIYISATNVETNRIKVFTNEDICTTSLLASSFYLQYERL